MLINEDVRRARELARKPDRSEAEEAELRRLYERAKAEASC